MKKVIKNNLLKQLKEELSNFNKWPYNFVRSNFTIDNNDWYLETSYNFDTKKSNWLVEEENNTLKVSLKMNLSRFSSLKFDIRLNEDTKINFDFIDKLLIENFKNNINVLISQRENFDFILLKGNN